jgi:peptidoglycan/LPS O-acetylase OafA/YrhL
VSPAAPRRLEALTTLRFFAALHVTLFHLLAQGEWGLPGPLLDLVRAGPVSVSFFFVLSGFILTQAYADRPPHRAPVAYTRSRFARIYPLYLLGLLLMAPWWFSLGGGTAAPSLASLALVQAWWPPWSNAWNAPAWSLSVEAFFYVLFPLVLPWTLRVSRGVLWGVAGAGWLVMLGASFAYVGLAPDGLATVDASSSAFWLDALKFHPLVRLPEFIVGLALGRAARDGARLPEGLGVVAVLALFAALSVSSRVPFPVLHNGLLTPLFAVVILGAGTTRSATARRVLEHRALVTMGEASYALYILQTPVLGFTHAAVRRVLPAETAHTAPFAALGLVAALVASVLAWRFVERPAREWLLGTPPRKP